MIRNNSNNIRNNSNMSITPKTERKSESSKFLEITPIRPKWSKMIQRRSKDQNDRPKSIKEDQNYSNKVNNKIIRRKSKLFKANFFESNHSGKKGLNPE